MATTAATGNSLLIKVAVAAVHCNGLFMQGALLMRFLEAPLYLSSVSIASRPQHLKRVIPVRTLRRAGQLVKWRCTGHWWGGWGLWAEPSPCQQPFHHAPPTVAVVDAAAEASRPRAVPDHRLSCAISWGLDEACCMLDDRLSGFCMVAAFCKGPALSCRNVLH